MPDLLIDTDTGIDDAVAIALAATLPSLHVVAITTVHGNTDVARATRNAREVARLVSLDVPVIAGAAAPLTRPARPARETHGEEGLGYVHPSTQPRSEPDAAAAEIIEQSRRHARLTLCMLGPLTNLARAATMDPDLPRRVGAVFVMGGTMRVKGTMTEWSEFNWWSDPEAVDAVLRAGFEVRLVPLDVTRRIAVPGRAIAALRSAGTTDETARFWGDALRFYADFHRSHERFDGCIVNDALAVALVADALLADWFEIPISVSCSDDARRGAITMSGAGGIPVRVALDVRARDVLTLVGEYVFGRWVSPEVMAEGASAAEQWLRENPPVAASR
ncbi:MAG TPA: nucleoside hydrolase [Gemmatimonadaceae bacterium]|nr:nucleoside hydrolase [Gemmatimonadaceae bacterium]